MGRDRWNGRGHRQMCLERYASLVPSRRDKSAANRKEEEKEEKIWKLLCFLPPSFLIYTHKRFKGNSLTSSCFRVNYATSAPIEWASLMSHEKRQTNTTTTATTAIRNSRTSPNESFFFSLLQFFLGGKCVARRTVNYIRKCCLFLYYIASWQTSNALFCTRVGSLSLSFLLYVTRCV